MLIALISLEVLIKKFNNFSKPVYGRQFFPFLHSKGMNLNLNPSRILGLKQL